ncbi:hypothetical protein KRR38_30495 [Novosphingobium sp. G106]|uniref:hypothetical protein n=1 Tax=Novosphingobium sp. G106 TaxID=2849500 RepID=UPI001C2D6157|nr:hypothetical protein [Novosphingobium sp. G106]MBV1691879.1 hypothetical protein [Novosphingobium sp. G106]
MKGHVLKRLAEHGPAIFAQYAGGADFKEIGEQYGCSWQTVRRFLIANDVPLRRPIWKLKLDPFETEICAAYAAGAEVCDLAAQYEVQSETVRRFLFARYLHRDEAI